MGTQVDVSLMADTPQQAAQLTAQVEQQMQRLGQAWYPWAAGDASELKQLNAALVNGSNFKVSPELAELLRRSQAFYRSSNGYFDPAVAPLVKAWGFTQIDHDPQAFGPTQDELQAWLEHRPTMGDLHIEHDQASSARRDLQLDLGAVGKGYVVALAMQQLQQQGIHDALINAGGKLRGIGTRAGQAWQIAIQDPRSEQALAWLQLRGDESAASSGDYQRYAEVEGQRIHHLLDPHTGRSVTHTQAVTVLSADATLADAAATALMAAGPEHWQAIARQMGIREVLRIDATGAIEVTAALYARLDWNSAAMRSRTVRQVQL